MTGVQTCALPIWRADGILPTVTLANRVFLVVLVGEVELQFVHHFLGQLRQTVLFHQRHHGYLDGGQRSGNLHDHAFLAAFEFFHGVAVGQHGQAHAVHADGSLDDIRRIGRILLRIKVFNFPFGFKELEGIHSRTNFDLGNHQKFSGKKIEYFDPEENTSYTPYVIETSIGVDRMVLAVLSHAYTVEELEGGDSRVVMKIPAPLAPIKVAVMPLVKKDGLPEVAQKVVDELKYDFSYQYDEKDSIGKRYRRQDAIGTPFCVTIDHDTLNDGMVTVRERDTMQQERVKIEDLRALIEKKVSLTNLLRNL